VLTDAWASLDASALIRLIRLAAQAHRNQKPIDRLPSGLRCPGSRRDLEDIFATSDAVTEEGWRGGCRGPCFRVPLRAAPFQWKSGWPWAALVGSQRLLPCWGFHVLLRLTKPVPFGGLVEG